MISKTIKYTDYNGVEREETFFFHLSKAELTEMQLGKTGGLSEYIKKIVSANDSPSLIQTFKELILKSYGEKSDDGRRFMKVDENGKPLSIGFSQTEAYSQLFMELAMDTEKASEFVKGIMPADMEISDEEVKQIAAENGVTM